MAKRLLFILALLGLFIIPSVCVEQMDFKKGRWHYSQYIANSKEVSDIEYQAEDNSNVYWKVLGDFEYNGYWDNSDRDKVTFYVRVNHSYSNPKIKVIYYGSELGEPMSDCEFWANGDWSAGTGNLVDVPFCRAYPIEYVQFVLYDGNAEVSKSHIYLITRNIEYEFEKYIKLSISKNHNSRYIHINASQFPELLDYCEQSPDEVNYSGTFCEFVILSEDLEKILPYWVLRWDGKLFNQSVPSKYFYDDEETSHSIIVALPENYTDDIYILYKYWRENWDGRFGRVLYNGYAISGLNNYLNMFGFLEIPIWKSKDEFNNNFGECTFSSWSRFNNVHNFGQYRTSGWTEEFGGVYHYMYGINDGQSCGYADEYHGGWVIRRYEAGARKIYYRGTLLDSTNKAGVSWQIDVFQYNNTHKDVHLYRSGYYTEVTAEGKNICKIYLKTGNNQGGGFRAVFPYWTTTLTTKQDEGDVVFCGTTADILAPETYIFDDVYFEILASSECNMSLDLKVKNETGSVIYSASLEYTEPEATKIYPILLENLEEGTYTIELEWSAGLGTESETKTFSVNPICNLTITKPIPSGSYPFLKMQYDIEINCSNSTLDELDLFVNKEGDISFYSNIWNNISSLKIEDIVSHPEAGTYEISLYYKKNDIWNNLAYWKYYVGTVSAGETIETYITDLENITKSETTQLFLDNPFLFVQSFLYNWAVKNGISGMHLTFMKYAFQVIFSVYFFLIIEFLGIYYYTQNWIIAGIVTLPTLWLLGALGWTNLSFDLVLSAIVIAIIIKVWKT